MNRVNELLNSKNKLEINLPKAFHKKLKTKASNNNMELNEYATFLITQEYYKEEKNRELHKYKVALKKQFIREHKEQETERNWLKDLNEEIKDATKLPPSGKKKFAVN